MCLNSFCIVLYSGRDGRWKIADFGTATKATSKRLHTTRYARGTTCYRAPEILREDARVNNKADMFALGCILYEITTGHKLFPNDWNIREYALKGEPIFPASWPTCVPGSRLYSLGELAQSLLEIDPFKRPSALRTEEALKLIRQGRVLEHGKPDGSQVHVTQIHPPSPPRTVNVAQVHYRRSASSFVDRYSSEESGGGGPAHHKPRRGLSAYVFFAQVCRSNCVFASFPLKSRVAELVSRRTVLRSGTRTPPSSRVSSLFPSFLFSIVAFLGWFLIVVGQTETILGQFWTKYMTEKDKAPYEAKATKDKERYEAEMRAYNVHYPSPQLLLLSCIDNCCRQEMCRDPNKISYLSHSLLNRI